MSQHFYIDMSNGGDCLYRQSSRPIYQFKKIMFKYQYKEYI